jgi:hypothetical protein
MYKPNTCLIWTQKFVPRRFRFHCILNEKKETYYFRVLYMEPFIRIYINILGQVLGAHVAGKIVMRIIFTW